MSRDELSAAIWECEKAEKLCLEHARRILADPNGNEGQALDEMQSARDYHAAAELFRAELSGILNGTITEKVYETLEKQEIEAPPMIPAELQPDFSSVSEARKIANQMARAGVFR